MKLMIIGPLPPKYGGTTILFKQFLDYLNVHDYKDCYFVVNTNNRCFGNKFGPIRLINICLEICRNVKSCDVNLYIFLDLLFEYYFHLFYWFLSY